MTETKKFPLISGYLSLDLINSEIVRRGQRQDLLLTEDDVLDWLKIMNKNTLIDDQLYLRAKERIGSVFLAMLEMRSVLRDNLESIADGKPIKEAFINYLEQKIKKAPFTYTFIQNKLTPVPLGEAEDALLSVIAFDTLNLIEADKLTVLKHCSNPECVLLFIDESGRRKWCSMKICGNRKKVENFQRRKANKSSVSNN